MALSASDKLIPPSAFSVLSTAEGADLDATIPVGSEADIGAEEKELRVAVAAARQYRRRYK